MRTTEAMRRGQKKYRLRQIIKRLEATAEHQSTERYKGKDWNVAELIDHFKAKLAEVK